MKRGFKSIFVIALLIVGLVGCGSTTQSGNSGLGTAVKSTDEQIREIYVGLIKDINNSDFSEARSKLSALNQLCEDNDISETDRKSAKCVYFYAGGIYKLLAAGIGVSGLQHPELMIIENNMQGYANGGQLSEPDKTLELAKQFFNAVNKEVK